MRKIYPRLFKPTDKYLFLVTYVRTNGIAKELKTFQGIKKQKEQCKKTKMNGMTEFFNNRI